MTALQAQKKDQDLLEHFNTNFESITDKYKIEKENIDNDPQIRITVIKITLRLAAYEQIDEDLALLGICSLMQSGAYLKSVTNRKITIGGKDFSKKTLLSIAEQIECKFTLRVIAKFLRTKIAQVGIKYKIPGNLYSKFKVENANFIANNTPEENTKIAAYCTDFQIDNPDTPPKVIEFLALREKTRNNR